MSLQIAAQHLASKGRGPDTTLVHMSEREVKGLQDIAKAHGGSLTLNPSTGLHHRWATAHCDTGLPHNRRSWALRV